MYFTQDQIDRANQATPPKEQKAEQKKAKSAAKKKHNKTEGKRNAENSQKCSVYAGFRTFERSFDNKLITVISAALFLLSGGLQVRE